MFFVVDLKLFKFINFYVFEVNGESVVLKWDLLENYVVVINYIIMYRKVALKGLYL